MSERKVLNKYYPPDFDPSKIPRGKRSKNATFNIRIMAPFNMRCNTCKEYIYKGKKFNSRKEDVMNEFYLGLRIFRFYIKCPRCVSEIAFKTDIENIDYELEAGATRLFEAEKLARQMEEQERKQIEEDELNPMKVLENRTKASIQEMDQIDSLEELREINSRKNIVNTEEMIEKYRKYEECLQQLQMEAEEKEIREIFGGEGTKIVKRLHDSDSDEDEPSAKKVVPSSGKPTDILAEDAKTDGKTSKKPEVWQKSVGSLSSKHKLSGLVVKKKTSLPSVPVTSRTSNQMSDFSFAGSNSSAENISANKSSASCDSSTAKESPNQRDCNVHDRVGVASSANQVTVDSDVRQENILAENTEADLNKRKVTDDMDVKTQGLSVKPADKNQENKAGQGSGGLNLLGAYSDSENSESD